MGKSMSLPYSEFTAQHRGHIGELSVAADLAKHGYTISFPAEPAPYDLLAERDGNIVRVQCKTIQHKERRGIPWYILRCKDSKNRAYTNVDLFAGFDPQSNRIYYRWEKDMGGRKEIWINSLSVGVADIPELIEDYDDSRTAEDAE